MFGDRLSNVFFLVWKELGHSDCFVWKMISCLNSFWMGKLFRMAISSAKKTCPYWKRAGTADDFSSLRVRYSDVDFGNIIMPKEPFFFLGRCLILIEDGRFHG